FPLPIAAGEALSDGSNPEHVVPGGAGSVDVAFRVPGRRGRPTEPGRSVNDFLSDYLALVRRIRPDPDDVPAIVPRDIDVPSAVCRECPWRFERETVVAVSEYFLGAERKAEDVVRTKRKPYDVVAKIGRMKGVPL